LDNLKKMMMMEKIAIAEYLESILGSVGHACRTSSR